MGRAAKLGGIASPGALAPVAPGNVLAITATGTIDPLTADGALTVGITPPATIGTFIGGHMYLEIPDQSAATPQVVGTTPAGTGTVTGQWSTIDLGALPYIASQQPWTVTFPAPPAIDPLLNTPCRLYVTAFSTAIENKLIRHGVAGETPNVTFTLQSLASGKPNAATNVTNLSGSIAATVWSDDNSTGKLETPVLVTIATAPNNIDGWSARIVLTWGSSDPTVAANQFPQGPVVTTAGPIYATDDGIKVPHSFALPTPTTIQPATLWLQSGLVDAGGNYQWNNIVPNITPSFPITLGTSTGTIDASTVMAATIAASMAVVNGLFGVAAAGITNPLLGNSAVATINVQALAITNPLLASLVVDAAKLATGAVTSTKIGAAAVGTAAIANAAITNALIANLAVSGAQIQSATITGANIASATIAGANIGTATVAQANIANLAVGTAQIQNLAVTDAKINDLSASKITAGTITATVSMTSPVLTITNGSITVNIDSTNYVLVSDSAGSRNTVQITAATATCTSLTTGAVCSLATSGIQGAPATSPARALYYFREFGMQLSDGTGFNRSAFGINVGVAYTATSATAGSNALPSNPDGFLIVTIAGATKKMPYYAN